MWLPSVASRLKSCSAESEIPNDDTSNSESPTGSQPDWQVSHRATVRGLGLRKLNSVSELQDTPAVRGMINKISYLVKVL